MERMIGEKFEYGGKWYQVQPVRFSGSHNCNPCAGIFNGDLCLDFECSEEERTDRRNVIAVECEAPDQLDTCHSPDSDNCHSRYNGACLGEGECQEMEVNLDFDRSPKTDVDGWSEEPAANPVEELAGAHWAYVKATLQIHGISDQDLLVIGHHYRTAFIHGYKHGRDGVKGCETCRYYESADADNRPCKDCRVVDLPKWEGKR